MMATEYDDPIHITNCIEKNMDISQGCVMPEPSNCKSGDDFPLTSGLMSQWDYVNNINLSLSDCKERCMNDCSCTAYSSLGFEGTGCRFSQGKKLVNVTSKAETFYMRNVPIVDTESFYMRKASLQKKSALPCGVYKGKVFYI